MKKLSCQEVLDRLSEYLDEDAQTELRGEVDRHTGTCHDCRVEVDTLRRTIKIFRCDEQVVLPAPLAEKLQGALESAYRDGRCSQEDDREV